MMAVAGVTRSLSDTVSLSGEISVDREEDAGDRRTETVAVASIAWQPRDWLQLDLFAAAGPSRAAPYLGLVAGGAIPF
jgi:hypothetical protein